MTARHIIVVGALPRSLLNFRGELIRALLANSYKVTAMAEKYDPVIVSQLSSMGAGFISFSVKRNSLNPVSDLGTVFSLRKTFKKLQPDVVLAYTIKPVIWGGLACRVMPSARFYALITGLGFTFQGESIGRKLLSYVASFLYSISLRRSSKVIFQNPENLREFVSRGIVPASKCVVVNGSGVDTKHFAFKPLPDGKITFLTIGRLLREKGFREYASAAKIIKKKYPNVVFQLLGPEASSLDGIPLDEFRKWHDDGIVSYLGVTEDVRPYLENCSIFVLPSYYGEGLPRTILEAMSTGRPILTTDNVGCRETVIPGDNGYLVPKADAQALAERMMWFIENREQWARMGKRSREIAEDKFDVHKVNKRLIEIMGL